MGFPHLPRSPSESNLSFTLQSLDVHKNWETWSIFEKCVAVLLTCSACAPHFNRDSALDADVAENKKAEALLDVLQTMNMFLSNDRCSTLSRTQTHAASKVATSSPLPTIPEIVEDCMHPSSNASVVMSSSGVGMKRAVSEIETNSPQRS